MAATNAIRSVVAPRVKKVGTSLIGQAQYTSIQAAINAAAADPVPPSATAPYTIEIYPGVYTEAITCSSYVHLKGMGPEGSVTIQQTDATILTLPAGVNNIENLVFVLVTPTQARTMFTDGGNANVCYLSNCQFSVTTPAARAITVISISGATTLTLNNIYSEIAGTGVSYGIKVTNAAAVVSSTGAGVQFGFTNVNAFVFNVSAAANLAFMNSVFDGTCSFITCSAGTFVWHSCRVKSSGLLSVNTGANHSFQSSYIAIPVVAGNLAIVRLRNCSYPYITRTGTGNVTDTTMRVFMGIYHTVNLNYSGTTATANMECPA